MLPAQYNASASLFQQTSVQEFLMISLESINYGCNQLDLNACCKVHCFELTL